MRALAKPAFVRSRIELGRSAQDLQRDLALRGSGVDRVLNGTKERTLGLRPLDHLQQMRQGSREAVNPHDHQRVALAGALLHPHKYRPRTIAARGLFFMDLGAACGFQGLRLGQGG